MTSEKLQHAPLVEAILEIKWKLLEQSPGVSVDPNYKILVGRLYDRLEKNFPFHEPLPTASMPDDMFPYVVQHRFRLGKGKWPLVQIGPGIVTLNYADESYGWDDFESRSISLLDTLFSVYPNPAEDLSINNIVLRYIDAIPFDFSKNDVSHFILENLKINLAFPSEFLSIPQIQQKPSKIDLNFAFPITNPKGRINLRFATGTSDDTKALIWETIVQSNQTDLPSLPIGFKDWLSAVHDITHNVFFKLIEGPLMERFK